MALNNIFIGVYIQFYLFYSTDNQFEQESMYTNISNCVLWSWIVINLALYRCETLTAIVVFAKSQLFLCLWFKSTTVRDT